MFFFFFSKTPLQNVLLVSHLNSLPGSDASHLGEKSSIKNISYLDFKPENFLSDI